MRESASRRAQRLNATGTDLICSAESEPNRRARLRNEERGKENERNRQIQGTKEWNKELSR